MINLQEGKTLTNNAKKIRKRIERCLIVSTNSFLDEVSSNGHRIRICKTGTVFTIGKKINNMVRTYSSDARKKLALRFILDSIDYRKRCLYLQDIILLGKIDDVWRRALSQFFDIPFKTPSCKTFSKN